jgi:hypothetical protein
MDAVLAGAYDAAVKQLRHATAAVGHAAAESYRTETETTDR